MYQLPFSIKIEFLSFSSALTFIFDRNYRIFPAGAGKTHTMLGIDSDPGIMVRALNDLFKKMELTSGESNYAVTMSYLEVRQMIFMFIKDLLSSFLLTVSFTRFSFLKFIFSELSHTVRFN